MQQEVLALQPLPSLTSLTVDSFKASTSCSLLSPVETQLIQSLLSGPLLLISPSRQKLNLEPSEEKLNAAESTVLNVKLLYILIQMAERNQDEE